MGHQLDKYVHSIKCLVYGKLTFQKIWMKLLCIIIWIKQSTTTLTKLFLILLLPSPRISPGPIEPAAKSLRSLLKPASLLPENICRAYSRHPIPSQKKKTSLLPLAHDPMQHKCVTICLSYTYRALGVKRKLL